MRNELVGNTEREALESSEFRVGTQKTQNSELITQNSAKEMMRFTGPQKFLLLGMVTLVCVAQAPLPGYTEESSTKSSQAVIPELELIKEEETVSIASRYEQPISKAPANVYVITDEDIRHSGATDLPTVLRRVPGLEVMQMSGADFNVSARGGNQPSANKMLVLVDGRSIYIDVQGSVFWKAIPVTLPEIKRIEVLKGPASSIYGFNAFDGIINIITKSPEEMKGTTMQLGGGELGTISSAAVHANKIGDFGYRLSIGRDQNQQWRNRDALAFRSHKVNLQTEYALPDGAKLLLSGGFVDVNRFDGQISEIVSPSFRPSQGYANMAYERPNFFLRGWWSSYQDTSLTSTNPLLANFIRVTDRDANSTLSYMSNSYNLETQHTLEFSPSNRLTYGVNYRHNSLSSNGTDVFSRENRLGIYLQDEWRVTQSLTLLAGLRYDLDTFTNPKVSPRVALVYQALPDHTFRVSASVAYRSPTLFETHADLRAMTTFSLPIVIQGSRGLEPEQIISYEAGYQGWFFNHRLRLRADLFFNHISDLITNRDTSATTATFVNDHGQADIYGGETGVEFLATSWLTGFANYSYQEVGQSFSGTVRRGAPRFKYNVGLRGDWDNGWSGEAALHHVGAANYPIAQTFSLLASIPGTGVVPPAEYLGSYNLLNLRGAYKFWQERAEAGYVRDAEVAISAFSALNDEHKEHPLGDTIGSRVMGWLTVRY
jgi:iron complex outermembrane recepter protein